jgi:hypothetical protein
MSCCRVHVAAGWHQYLARQAHHTLDSHLYWPCCCLARPARARPSYLNDSYVLRCSRPPPGRASHPPRRAGFEFADRLSGPARSSGSEPEPGVAHRIGAVRATSVVRRAGFRATVHKSDNLAINVPAVCAKIADVISPSVHQLCIQIRLVGWQQFNARPCAPP